MQQQQQASIIPKSSNVGSNMKPGQSQQGGKSAFVICEICDGWIKDLDQLRNHMQWMHKVKVILILISCFNFNFENEIVFIHVCVFHSLFIDSSENDL